MNEISFNWRNIFTNLILLIILVVILTFGFKNNFSFSSNSGVLIDKVFNENIQTMKEAAKDYFTIERLPREIGIPKKLTLQEMLDKKMLLNFTDKNNKTCNTEFSYVEVTKITETEYQLKVMLACGEQIDYIIDTIGCYDTCKDCKTETKTQYQYSKVINGEKTTYSCPEGYSLNGKYCYKKLGVSYTANVVEGDTTTKVTDAKKTTDQTYKEYTETIKTIGKSTYKCEQGSMNKDNTCTITSSTTINASPNYAYKCNEGSLTNNNSCKITNTTNATVNYAYKCSEGSLTNNNNCKITNTTNATANYAYKCSEGSLTSDNKCAVTNYSSVNAKISSYSYGNWKTITSYKRTNAMSAYNNGTEKLVYEGTTREYSCGTPTYCPTKVTYYHYTLYRRTSTPIYSCSTGTLSGSKCNSSYTSYNNSEKYIKSYSCKTGSLDGTKCITTNYENATKYVKSYSCKAGSLDGTKCITTNYENATKYVKSYSCKTGSLVDTNKCKVSANSVVPATEIIGKTTYSCPNGYNAEGNGSSLKCYITKINDGLYYCDGANQSLEGNKCYEEVKSDSTYTCKDGYILNGDKCIKTCNKKIDAISSTTSTSKTSSKWSEEKSLKGYTSTGKYRIIDEKGNVIKTGSVNEIINNNENSNEKEIDNEVKKMVVNNTTDSKTSSTMEYIMYAIIIVGVIILAFASITMVRVKRYTN